MNRPAGFALAFKVNDEQTMHEFERQAEAAGLVVVTDGRVIQLAWPGAVPEGFRVFALVERRA